MEVKADAVSGNKSAPRQTERIQNRILDFVVVIIIIICAFEGLTFVLKLSNDLYFSNLCNIEFVPVGCVCLCACVIHRD